MQRNSAVEDGQVTRLLGGLKSGKGEDIGRLWEIYFERLAQLARSRLPRGRCREFDEEDVALSAFQSFCDRAGRGQFPRLDDRDDLWRLLATLTTRKLVAALRHQARQKRGGGRLRGESAVLDGTDAAAGAHVGLDQFLGREPSPEEAACFADEVDRLLAGLDDPVLKSIAARKLEGFSSEEIASALEISARTVDRKVLVIRALWERAAETANQARM
jgi:DNA-directed RNA polymerase specialized sigma24 family protein